ncbi:putative GNAT superfamily acetyltransferase [Kibdelosporangium banguiense]|uniref:GNAT superfamily acetyltransferase n=1 Tax=Kibdelosporangium banguiense TaxID=1365924 RepID=A0ABS4TPS4_9PSEU|nr:GNAT family N-acetyltransferase [Kibdelosporangium banguiense]MBP2326401.1 putative GNAT superfamily acetyltransferase [Kibdelosporangium banguiense]
MKLIEDDAAHAAAAARVVIRELTELEELNAVYELYNEIWRPDPTNPPVTTELLRALTKAGNYVSGAYDGRRLVGACVGFFGTPSETTLHSHVAGVSASAMGRSVGFALKLHQRAWAAGHGLTSITWTFDPLVSRNAYFNLMKLGATPTEYLPNFYGGMHDGINGNDESDRLLVHWDLGKVGAPVVQSRSEAVIALDRSDTGLPVAGALDGQTLLVAAPRDIESLRAADPSAAKLWRVAMRDVLGTLLAEGARVTGYDRSGWYLVSRKDS